MTREEKRIKIAEACGWTEVHEFFNENYSHPYDYRKQIRGMAPCTRITEIPDYFGSLDAMHEAVLLRCTTPLNLSEWEFRLRKLLANERPSFEVDGYEVANATADQRAEAFGLALNLWKEGE